MDHNGLGFILFIHHQYLNALHLYNKLPRACQVQVTCVGLNNPEESYAITAYTDSSCIHEVSLQQLGTSSQKTTSSLGNTVDAKKTWSLCGKMPGNEPYHLATAGT